MSLNTLEGPILDAAVAVALGYQLAARGDATWAYNGTGLIGYIGGSNVPQWSPSTNWSQAGPIIEQSKLCIMPLTESRWFAEIWIGAPGTREDKFVSGEGVTPLLAAMRCYLKSRPASTQEKT